MPVKNPFILNLLHCISLEEDEQVKRYRLDQQHSLKALKTEGLALHPISVVKKTFGYADYPEISFRLPYPTETNLFKDGAAIECFLENQDPVKGVLLSLENNTGEFRLFSPDYPEWIEDAGVGIKLAPDQRTTLIMKTALNNLEQNKTLLQLFEQLHSTEITAQPVINYRAPELKYYNTTLNTSQQDAAAAMLQDVPLTIIHGPPGTGKTTTLLEGIGQLVKMGEKVLVSAPSNTAVDNIAKGLINKGLIILRIGNTSKVDELLFKHTPEGKLSSGKEQKEIKQLKIRAEEFRRMALKYKRSFGKAEREQRNLLFKEVKNIRTAIKELQAYNESRLYKDAAVILGTPVGIHDAKLQRYKFNTLVIDEAGQCIEPLAWTIFPLANKYVLAGDHLQLPPTVLSHEATKLGFTKSILEVSIKNWPNVFLLNTQYRMRAAIAGFSGNYFYNDLLLTASHLANNEDHIFFIDTAGSGFNETAGMNGMSLQNEGELRLAEKLLKEEIFVLEHTAFISPYAGQVAVAKELLPKGLRICTIDSFQGQEAECIIISLVRSNDECDIGFLKDYRRMNVALTRAKQKLFVIGDSATIGADAFYNSFLAYIEKYGNYKSVWEYDL